MCIGRLPSFELESFRITIRVWAALRFRLVSGESICSQASSTPIELAPRAGEAGHHFAHVQTTSCPHRRRGPADGRRLAASVHTGVADLPGRATAMRCEQPTRVPRRFGEHGDRFPCGSGDGVRADDAVAESPPMLAPSAARTPCRMSSSRLGAQRSSTTESSASARVGKCIRLKPYGSTRSRSVMKP
jgi:hypothetical protein